MASFARLVSSWKNPRRLPEHRRPSTSTKKHQPSGRNPTRFFCDAWCLGQIRFPEYLRAEIIRQSRAVTQKNSTGFQARNALPCLTLPCLTMPCLTIWLSPGLGSPTKHQIMIPLVHDRQRHDDDSFRIGVAARNVRSANRHETGLHTAIEGKPFQQERHAPLPATNHSQ